MTPEAQQLAIAEACGWREAFPKHSDPHAETKRGGILLPYYWVNEITHARAEKLPDYLNDLNAIHEAEKLVDAIKYYEQLYICDKTGSFIGYKHLWHATAAQRAEAFLRFLGKWQENEQAIP